MARFTRKRLQAMSLAELKRLQHHVTELIAEIESCDLPRDIDVATSFNGNNDRVAELIVVLGNKESGKWRQTQTIYCSGDRCANCPHGPFLYRYWRQKSGRLRVDFRGWPAFDTRQIMKMLEKCTEPIARGQLVWREPSKGDSG